MSFDRIKFTQLMTHALTQIARCKLGNICAQYDYKINLPAFVSIKQIANNIDKKHPVRLAIQLPWLPTGSVVDEEIKSRMPSVDR